MIHRRISICGNCGEAMQKQSHPYLTAPWTHFTNMKCSPRPTRIIHYLDRSEAGWRGIHEVLGLPYTLDGYSQALKALNLNQQIASATISVQQFKLIMGMTP